MGKTFCKHICHICGKEISANGLGKAAHYRSHVLQEECVEMGTGQLYWTPKDVPLDIQDPLSLWQRNNMTKLAEQMQREQHNSARQYLMLKVLSGKLTI